MRLERLAVRGLGPFRDDVEVDLGALDARIIAVVGLNGAGKSSLLELWPGAMYRQLPTRGALPKFATRRDAMVEATVVNGQRYTIRQVVDAVSGKGEAVVLDEEGRPLIESGKVRDFDRWAAVHLIPEQVLYATNFGVQGGRQSFLSMSRSDRKGVILRALGIEHLEALAERARERSRQAKADLQTLVARIEDAREGALDPEQARQQLEEAEQRAKTADEAVALYRGQLEELREQAARAEEARVRAREIAERRTKLGEQLEAERARVQDLERRLANNHGVMERAETIRAAQKRDAELADEREQVAEAVRKLETDRERLQERAGQHAADQNRAEEERRQAKERVEKARQRLAQEGDVEDARRRLPELEQSLKAQEQALERTEGQFEAARGRQLAGADDRIRSLRGYLHEIATDDLGDSVTPADHAGDALREDDEQVEAAESVPQQIASLEEAVAAMRKTRDEMRRTRDETQRLADRAEDIAAAREDMKGAKAAVEAADERAHAADAERQARLEEVAALDETLTERRRQLRELVDKRAALIDDLRLADKLAQAEARIAELEPQAEHARGEVSRIEAELEQLGPTPQAPLRPDTSEVERQIADAEEAQQTAHGEAAVARQSIEAAEAAAKKVEDLEAERRRTEAELADWTRLGQDLGREGVQALEVDAAGPELTELTNDLLHSCHGSRFTASIQTTRQSADGKKQIEDCEVWIADNQEGREGAAETFSGGELAIVNETIALALSVMACRRAGVEGATLVRDETAAALDPPNRRVYVAMLRRAADMVGADKVLFVSHAEDMNDLADAQLHVHDGRVEVRQ